MANAKESPRAREIKRKMGPRLRAVRTYMGFENAADLARELGVDAFRYRQWERGTNMPSIDILEQISKMSGKSLDWLLLGGMDDRTN